MRRICGGMVAENRATWRCSGSASTFSTSSMKPMRSISSASSSTSVQLDRSSVPRSEVVDHAAGRADDDVRAAAQAANCGP
jgi:hypothetical protein